MADAVLAPRAVQHVDRRGAIWTAAIVVGLVVVAALIRCCLLYTSDAADEL